MQRGTGGESRAETHCGSARALHQARHGLHLPCYETPLCTRAATSWWGRGGGAEGRSPPGYRKARGSQEPLPHLCARLLGSCSVHHSTWAPGEFRCSRAAGDNHWACDYLSLKVSTGPHQKPAFPPKHPTPSLICSEQTTQAFST